MSFKFVVLSSLLAVASAGYIAPIHNSAAPTIIAKVVNPAIDAVASTYQNVERSFDGTVSQYLKSIHTPYSSVDKSDTRVNNNVYTPTLSKTINYAAPAVTKTISYAAPTNAVYSTQAAPAVTKTVYTHQQPKNVYTHEQPHAHAIYTSSVPQTVYTHEQPQSVYASPAPNSSVYHHSAPAADIYQREVPSTATSTYNHGPATTTYTHNSPAISANGLSQTVHYSPAEMVSHMSFDGFGTHWGN